jgi:uncharacterized membrane protein
MEQIKVYIDYIAKFMESIGVLTIVFGSIYSLIRYLVKLRGNNQMSFPELRQSVGKSILLGLELLVAADIIATVVTSPTLLSVSILGLIVLIRTFLSLSLQVELEGKFPWQKAKSKNSTEHN